MNGTGTGSSRNRKPSDEQGGEPGKPSACARDVSAEGREGLPRTPGRRPIPIGRARLPLGGLTECERRILRIRFAARRAFPTYSEVACRLGLPVWTVRRLEGQALRKLALRARSLRRAGANAVTRPLRLPAG